MWSMERFACAFNLKPSVEKRCYFDRCDDFKDYLDYTAKIWRQTLEKIDVAMNTKKEITYGMDQMCNELSNHDHATYTLEEIKQDL